MTANHSHFSLTSVQRATLRSGVTCRRPKYILTSFSMSIQHWNTFAIRTMYEVRVSAWSMTSLFLTLFGSTCHRATISIQSFQRISHIFPRE